MADKDYADLAAKVAALEERMNTKQAEYKTDISLLEAANSKRHVQLILAILAMISLAVVVLKFWT